MSIWENGPLSTTHQCFVEEHLDGLELVEDMSWGLIDTSVLHVRSSGADFVVKCAGPTNHHIGREITAHESSTQQLVDLGLASRMIAFDRSKNILITTYLQGRLAQGSSVEFDYDIHVQAGAALRALHGMDSVMDPDYERRATEKSLNLLGQSHRIDPLTAHRARILLTDYRPRPVAVVPTHGDWQPRNWLVHEERLRVIDFGRFEYRPPATDLCRLAAQQWSTSNLLEDAFIEGYETDPRDEEVWLIDLLREAIGTAVWAYQVGDQRFEDQGHRMLARALRRFDK